MFSANFSAQMFIKFSWKWSLIIIKRTTFIKESFHYDISFVKIWANFDGSSSNHKISKHSFKMLIRIWKSIKFHLPHHEIQQQSSYCILHTACRLNCAKQAKTCQLFLKQEKNCFQTVLMDVFVLFRWWKYTNMQMCLKDIFSKEYFSQ